MSSFVEVLDRKCSRTLYCPVQEVSGPPWVLVSVLRYVLGHNFVECKSVGDYPRGGAIGIRG
eukprot:9155274-Prorocentrum_lima.AAC.1